MLSQPRLGSVNKLEWLICSLERVRFLWRFKEREVNVVFGNDMVTHSKTIYDENFNHKLTLKNINEVDNKEIPAHDILTGGFPCPLQYCRSSGWV
jgi:hypothetical protein